MIYTVTGSATGRQTIAITGTAAEVEPSRRLYLALNMRVRVTAAGKGAAR